MVVGTDYKPTPPGPVPMQAADTLLFKMAYEFAREIYTKDDILRSFSIDEVYFDTKIVPHPLYQQYYREARVLWLSSLSATERVQVKAAVAFEEALESLSKDLTDNREGLPGRVRLAELLARIAGLEKPKDIPTGAGEKISININFGAASQPPMQFSPVAPLTVEGTVVKVSDGRD